MASATKATRVMLPNAVTKSLHSNARCNFPLARVQPVAWLNRSLTSASLNFFATGMSSPTAKATATIMHRAGVVSGRFPGPAQFGFTTGLQPKSQATPVMQSGTAASTPRVYSGATHAKLAASFVSPLPLYLATCGYAHSGRVICTSAPGPDPAYFVAMIAAGVDPLSTHCSSDSCML